MESNLKYKQIIQVFTDLYKLETQHNIWYLGKYRDGQLKIEGYAVSGKPMLEPVIDNRNI